MLILFIHLNILKNAVLFYKAQERYFPVHFTVCICWEKVFTWCAPGADKNVCSFSVAQAFGKTNPEISTLFYFPSKLSFQLNFSYCLCSFRLEPTSDPFFVLTLFSSICFQGNNHPWSTTKNEFGPVRQIMDWSFIISDMLWYQKHSACQRQGFIRIIQITHFI